MSVGQVLIRWTGFAGAPGTTTLNFGPGAPDPVDGEAMIDAADAFANEIRVALGGTTVVQVDPEVNWFNEATGVLEDVTAIDPIPAPHIGTAGSNGPLPSGAVMSWQTAGINRGHKVRGRTFVVPLAAASYEANGTLQGVIQTALNTAAVNLMAAPGATFGIWSRPLLGAGGAWFPATSVRVPDMAAVLRSRRD